MALVRKRSPDDPPTTSRVDWIVRANLEERLRDWAREYSGPIIIGAQGLHILAKLIEFGGFLPGSTAPRNQVDPTPADEIEAIVRRMKGPFPANAVVLRCDYFRPDMPNSARLEMLGRIGFSMSRPTYFQRLNEAKHFVAGALVGD